MSPNLTISVGATVMKHQRFKGLISFFNGSGGWKPRVKVMAGVVPGETSLPGLLTGTFSLSSHMVEKKRQSERKRDSLFEDYHIFLC